MWDPDTGKNKTSLPNYPCIFWDGVQVKLSVIYDIRNSNPGSSPNTAFIPNPKAVTLLFIRGYDSGSKHNFSDIYRHYFATNSAYLTSGDEGSGSG